MIKKLKRKFIIITMGSLFFIMLLLVGSINAINLYQLDKKMNAAIQILSDNQGKFPKYDKDKQPKNNRNSGFHMNEETQFVTRYFIVEVKEDGSIQKIDTSHIAAVTTEDANDYANNVIRSEKDSGYEGYYKYAVIEKSYGSMLVFVDCSNQIQTATEFLFTSLGVAALTLVLMFILVSLFSKKAINPIIESIEKQKQFITDAGHEIKTPLAIISANTDVLELTSGENEWIASIRNQTVRLNKLVKNLLVLSKMDEANMNLVFSEFNLSETVLETVASFESIAEMKNMKLLMEIQPELKMQGDEGSIHQLISTLVENAVKYSNEEGTIKVSLSSYKKGVKIEVYNSTEEIDKTGLDKLFDRFYRADTSRSRETGGYGIGLSIAKSIVEAHHGKIMVKSDDGKSICFTILM